MMRMMQNTGGGAYMEWIFILKNNRAVMKPRALMIPPRKTGSL